MIQDDEYIQTLMKFGLTFLQAKTYLALAKLGKAEAKTIAKASNVARQDIYRVMPKLEKLGLAEKIVVNPTMYKATPIKEGYYILLQNETQEHTELQQQTIDLIKKTYVNNYKINLQEEAQHFFLITSDKLNLKKAETEDSITETSLDAIGEWKAVRAYVLNHIQIYEKALKRGVKIRIVTEKHEDNKSMRKILLFKNNPLFEIRYFNAPIPIKAAIYDGKKVMMSVRTLHDSEITPSLWSDNPQFVKVVVAYFEGVWNNAQA